VIITSTPYSVGPVFKSQPGGTLPHQELHGFFLFSSKQILSLYLITGYDRLHTYEVLVPGVTTQKWILNFASIFSCCVEQDYEPCLPHAEACDKDLVPAGMQ
jgi:hypothetical protein